MTLETKAMTLSSPYAPLKFLNRQFAALRLLLSDPSIACMPQWVSFQNTVACNLRCPHCQIHGMKKEYDKGLYTMPFELLKAAAEEALPAADFFTLSLIGEPLASPHLETTLDELGRYGAALDLITNGTLFTANRLALLIPITRKIQISVDATTEKIYEAIRLGANFRKVMNNIRLLTRTIELLPEDTRPQVSLSCTIMGSTIKDLPNIVRLAHLLGISEVSCCLVTVFYEHLKNEAVELYKPLYNAYFEEAQHVAQQLDITLILPPLFEGVEADIRAPLATTNMIVEQPPEEYYRKTPSVISYLDFNAIEKEAVEVSATISSEASHPKEFSLGKVIRAKQKQLQKQLHTLVAENLEVLTGLYTLPDQPVKYCEYLERCVYISSQGDVVPCCIPDRPVLGNINQSSITEVYNGSAYTAFRHEFYSNARDSFCSRCKFIRYIPRKVFLAQVFKSVPSHSAIASIPGTAAPGLSDLVVYSY